MTHQIYTAQQLQAKSLTELKQLYAAVGATVEVADQQRLLNNQQGYQDAIAHLPMQSNDPCYRMGYDRGLRDITPQTVRAASRREDSSSQAIAFEAVGKNIYKKVS